MAIKLPTVAPTVQTPKVTLPGGNIVGRFMSQKPAAQMPTMQNLRPMPDYVANNINLGWNYATGQVIQPLSAAQKAAVAIPPIGNLGIKTPTQTVYPVAPQPMQTYSTYVPGMTIGQIAPGATVKAPQPTTPVKPVSMPALVPQLKAPPSIQSQLSQLISSTPIAQSMPKTSGLLINNPAVFAQPKPITMNFR